jgi:hypothetical protein
MSDSIPEPLHDLLVELHVISMIEKGYKINIKSMSFVSSSSFMGSFKRLFQGEGRENLVIYLNQTIQNTITSLAEYNDVRLRTSILKHLIAAKKGISNLLTTYQNDPNIFAKISIFLENIDIQLDKYKEIVSTFDKK